MKIHLSQVPAGIPFWSNNVRFVVVHSTRHGVVCTNSLNVVCRPMNPADIVEIRTEKRVAVSAHKEKCIILKDGRFYHLCGHVDNPDYPLKDYNTGFYADSVGRYAELKTVV